MLKKNDQIEIIEKCVNLMHFCNDAAKIMTPDPTHSETMQKTCEGLSKIFLALEEDFEKIAKMVMKGFSDKEIKMILKKKKKKIENNNC